MPVFLWQAFQTISSGHDQNGDFSVSLMYKLSSQLREWQLKPNKNWVDVASSSLFTKSDNENIYLAAWDTSFIKCITDFNLILFKHTFFTVIGFKCGWEAYIEIIRSDSEQTELLGRLWDALW